MFAVALRRPTGHRRVRGAAGLSAGWAGALATGGYVVSEFAADPVVGSHGVPPPLVLLAGAVIQALVGAAAGVVWRRSADRVLLLADALCRAPAAVPARPTSDVPAAPLRRPRRRWAVHRLAGRAPPVVPHSA
jgi:hypothetical protein